ncbi:MAG: shikimate kinase [Thermoanaerobaculia bacterium]
MGAERVPRAERIYLTGFMGAGKSAAGRQLARALGWEFVDLDERIREAGGSSIAELFERRGEDEFRRLERAELAATLHRVRVVVATGGGTLAQPGALESLRGRGLIVWLKLPFAELVARVEAAGAGSRPLYGDRQQARELYRERLPFYRQADLVLAVEGGQSVESVVRRLVAELGVEACAT